MLDASPIQQFHRVSAPPSEDVRAHGADRVVLRRPLVLVVVAICALAAFVVAYNTWQDRQRRLAAAHKEAATLSRLLAEQTSSMLGATNFALFGLAEDVRRDRDLRPHDRAFVETLRRLRDNLPAARALVVIGRNGLVTHDSEPNVGRGNLSHRDYFRIHAETRDAGLFIGKPVLIRSGGWVIGVSRRVETPDGKFDGVVVAPLNASYFERLYQHLELGPGDVVALAMRDGTLIARQPRVADAIGKPFVTRTGESMIGNAPMSRPLGTFEAVSSIDGTTRIFGYATLADQPLVVIVGLSREQVLAPWASNAIVAGAVTAAAFALAWLLLWLAVRQARREAAIKARVETSARLESIARLTSGVAHDFNNLLQVMGAALRLLGKRNPDDPKAVKVVEQGLESLERGRSLVGQLLGLARPQEAQPQAVDVNALLRRMTTLLRSAAAPSASVVLDLPVDVRLCRTDPAQLEASLLNLVVNARDAMPPERQEKGTVRISTANIAGDVAQQDNGSAEQPHRIRITVQDNGVGMPPAVAERAVQTFFTTKGDRGTGLGLAQVYSFVHSFGGDMKIESEVGAGTSVHLFLPAAEGADAPP